MRAVIQRVTHARVTVAEQIIGEVGKGCGPLVRGNHQIRVVAVMPNNLGRRHDAVRARSFRDDIIGQVEQAADQDFIAFNALDGRVFARVKSATGFTPNSSLTPSG